MAVYVDNHRAKYRGMIMSHMFSDTLEELHAMADRLGLKREWFQATNAAHYDVCRSKRNQAIKLGAVLVDCRTTRWREVLEVARQQLKTDEENVWDL